MPTFRDMNTVNAGIFADTYDLDLITHCLQHFLDREYKKNCSKMAGIATADIGSLLFYQVRYKNPILTIHLNLHFRVLN
jgi:hypothetical protein